MSFLDTMREILETEGLLKHDTQKAARTQPRADIEAWQAAWRELAAITDGIRADDPRFQLVMATLKQCDIAFLANNWLVFRQAAQQVREAVTRDEGG